MLTDPEAHGGDPEDAFTVIVPSIIGLDSRNIRWRQALVFSITRKSTTN